MRLGNILREMSRVDDAETAFEKAVEIYQRLVRENLDASKIRSALATCCLDAGLVYGLIGSHDREEACYQQAVLH
jgi:tetratricopeptide (TPR) repeat protein